MSSVRVGLFLPEMDFSGIRAMSVRPCTGNKNNTFLFEKKRVFTVMTTLGLRGMHWSEEGSATHIPDEERDSARVFDRVVERKGHVYKDVRDF